MAKPMSWFAQALLYALFAAVIGYFSGSPQYRNLPPEHALVKVSFSLHGKPVSECHRRTTEELAKLPPNMRAPMDCARERSPVVVEIDLDGRPAWRHVVEPSGLSKDGPSTVYHRFWISSGEHRVAIRLDDDARVAGFEHHREETVTLAPARVLVIDFDPASDAVTLR